MLNRGSGAHATHIGPRTMPAGWLAQLRLFRYPHQWYSNNYPDLNQDHKNKLGTTSPLLLLLYIHPIAGRQPKG
jgi:hypothetical protein